jgi:hypothetical protein
MTQNKKALEADIRELQMAANIADTFHGRNCIAALDRIEAALQSASVGEEVLRLLGRMTEWAEIANSFVDPETTDVTIEGGETFNMADDIAKAKDLINGAAK